MGFSIKKLYDFKGILQDVIKKNEPSLLARYLIELAQSFSNFYNDNKIICDDEDIKNARVYLTYGTGIVLKAGAKLLGIEMPDKM